jgi:hypothetical protein
MSASVGRGRRGGPQRPEGVFPVRRFITLLSATLVGLAMLTGVAQAQPVTVTVHEHKATETFTEVFPCIGNGQELATITTVENGVIHVTAAALGPNDELIPPYHITGTFTGTFTAVPQNPSLPTFTGHFTTWFGENSNQKTFNGTFTFTIIATGSDGSTLKFHETAHVTVNAQGEVTVEFDRPSCF